MFEGVDCSMLNRRELLKLTAAAAASAALPGCGSESWVDDRPNIVFVIADQLRADVLGAYGGRLIETPHLDQLAVEGTTFEHGLSTAPLCTPYRGMLMTGRYPTHSGIVVNRVEASPEQNPDCLGVLFKKAGYDTGYIGKWHLAAGMMRIPTKVRKNPEALRAWQAEHLPAEFVPPGPGRLGFEHWEAYNYHADVSSYWFFRDDPEPVHAEGYETDIIIDQAIDYMKERRKAARPFLLVASPHPPHPPYIASRCPSGFLERMPRHPELPPNVPADAPVRTNPEPVRCYLAMIQHFDTCVGRLVRYLDESGLSRNTLLIFTSDHGEMMGSHGQWGKQLPYRESVNVPLIARWPGRVAAGARSRALFTPMDHLPTLCALAGIDAPDYLDGVDLSRALLNGTPGDRDAVLMMNPIASMRNFKSAGAFREWRALYSNSHTFVSWRDGGESLYDARHDPFQMRNLAAETAAKRELSGWREQLASLMAQAHDTFPSGSAYGEWYDGRRNLVRTALGPVPTL